MSDHLPFCNSLKVLAGSVRSGTFDQLMTADTLEKLSEVAGRIEIENIALRTLKQQRDHHRLLEQQAEQALHNVGAFPIDPPFQPIKTAKDLKADNVTPFRPRDRDKT